MRETSAEQKLLREVQELRSELNDTRRSFCDVTLATKVQENGVDTLENLPHLRAVHQLRAHSSRVHQVVWSPYDDILMSVGADSFVGVWDVKRGLLRNLVDTTMNQTTTVDCSPELDIVYCGGLYAKVEAYTLNHRSAEDGYSEYTASTVFEHEGRINAVTCLKDRGLLTAAAVDGAVLWDVDSVKVIAKFNHQPADVLCLQPLTSNGQNFITGSSDGVPRVWDKREATPLVSTMGGHESELTCIEMLPNETTFVTGSDDTSLHLYDLRLDFPIARYTKPEVSALGRHSLARSRTMSENWSSENGGQVTTGGTRSAGDKDNEEDLNTTPGVSGIGVSTSGRIVLSGCRDSYLYVWDLCDTTGAVEVLRQPGPVMSLKMAHDKHAFALMTWDVKTKIQIFRPT
ncbi:WD repeat-containing protein 49 [Sparganum proliferum]